jgi:hypothetical protein
MSRSERRAKSIGQGQLGMKLGSCRVLAQKPVSYPIETLSWDLVLSLALRLVNRANIPALGGSIIKLP